MTADLAGPGAATAPSWLAAMFERDEVDGQPVPPSAGCALQSRSASPAVARDFTARTLRAWGFPRLVPDAQVVVSELVTNALRHAPPVDPPTAQSPTAQSRTVQSRTVQSLPVQPSTLQPPARPMPADPPGAPILLRLVNHVDSSGRFHIGCGVSDASERVPALTRGSDLSAETGRGLHLVQALSVAWGWILTGGGKVVWAVLDGRS